MRIRHSIIGVCLLVGVLAAPPSSSAAVDADNDGVSAPADCNDNDPRVHPGAAEIESDLLDSDCDGKDFPRLSGYRASTYRLYQAYFLREPDQSGWAYWGNEGLSVAQMSYLFEQSAEFRTTYGGVSNRDFITLVYQNVLGRTPDSDGYSYWLNLMNGGLTRGNLMINFSESLEFGRKTGTVAGAEEVPLLLTTTNTVANNDCSYNYNKPATISGSVYPNSTYCSNGSSETNYVDWLLNRDYSKVTAQLGLLDSTSSSVAVMRYNVYLDDVLATTYDISYGQSRSVVINTSGVLRIRFEAISIGGIGGRPGIGSPAAYSTSDLGRPLPTPVETVAELLLTKTDTVANNDCSYSYDKPAAIGGATYEHSTYCSNGSNETNSIDWLLSRRYRSLTATLGLLDSTSNSAARFRYIVYFDNREVARYDLAYGQTRDVSYDVTGVLRVRIETIPIAAIGGRPGIARPVARP